MTLQGGGGDDSASSFLLALAMEALLGEGAGALPA